MKTFMLTLGITLAVWANASAAGLTEEQKCAMKADLLAGKLSLCLSKADANVSKGKIDLTDDADLKCESKFRSSWGKTREKSQGKDPGLGPDCDGKMTDGVRDSVEASALIAAGRELTIFQVNAADLADESGIQILVDAAIAGVDITSNDQSICENAGGIWELESCTAGAVYNCTVGAMCSRWASEYPGDLGDYANDYEGHAPGVGPAVSCDALDWDDTIFFVDQITSQSFDNFLGIRSSCCDGSGDCYSCPSGDTCTPSYTPNGSGCVPNYAVIGTGCNDGNNGTNNDVCNGAGSCSGTFISCPGGDTCTPSYIPNGSGCSPNYAPSGTTCNDGNPGTINDTCNGAGSCWGTP
ncbi:MAG: hypothetical protein P8R45_01945 [Candidatus Binatia bacterium]|nr:hypothetical protein [Candidatus Binatia bacterium]